MRVLHILNELKPSGAEVMLRSAATEFTALGVEGTILATGAQPGIFAPELERAGYRVLHLPFRKSPAFFLALRRLILDSGCDVVHSHTERANFWIGLTILSTGRVGALRTFHNAYPFEGLLRRVRGFERRLLGRLGVLGVAISPSVKDNESQRFGCASEVVNNWYDSHRFRLPTAQERAAARQAVLGADERFVVLSVGNCSAVKNHGALVDALGALPAGKPFLYLHAGTETPGREELAAARALRLESSVRFLGPVMDVRELFFAADAYVMPSIYEGFGIAAAEALACGVPCVFADCPGLKDFRQYGLRVWYTGIDSVSIRAALEDLMARPAGSLAEPLEANAVRTREMFGIEQGARAYTHLYERAAAGQARAPSAVVGR